MAKLVYSLGGVRQERSCRPDAESALAALEEVQVKLLQAGQVPTEIKIAGESLPPEMEAAARYIARQPRQDLTIEIESAPLAAMILETANSAAEYIGRLLTAVPELADALYSGEPQQPEHLDQLLEGLAWIADYLKVGFPFLDARESHQRQAATLAQRFHRAVEQLAPALTENDPTLLADILLDEVLPVIQDILQATLAIIGLGATYE